MLVMQTGLVFFLNGKSKSILKSLVVDNLLISFLPSVVLFSTQSLFPLFVRCCEEAGELGGAGNCGQQHGHPAAPQEQGAVRVRDGREAGRGAAAGRGQGGRLRAGAHRAVRLRHAQGHGLEGRDGHRKRT